ncbi:MAG: transposase [Ferruginibacter sp.]|nr:transposase [Ferruginibacter sp.]
MFLLAHKINWSVFEDNFKKHYSETMGKPAKPIRLMVSLLILKHVRNLSDENLVEHWSENLYYQYFGGEQFFQPIFHAFLPNWFLLDSVLEKKVWS